MASAAKVQADAEVFNKLMAPAVVAATTPNKPGLSQADIERYIPLAAAGTATPNGKLVNQGLAEQYHRLSGTGS